LIINYGFKTAREHTEAENKTRAVRAQLSRTRAKLAEANAQIVKLEAYTEELVSLLASMPKIEKQLKKSVGIENKRERPAPLSRSSKYTKTASN
jgi:transposase